MTVYRDQLPAEIVKRKTAVTVGTFDGVHIGHGAILEALRRAATHAHAIPLVATFDTHPRSVISGDSHSVALLTSFDEKLQLLALQGIEHVVLIHFDEAIRKLTPREFVAEHIVKQWNAGYVIAGYNHSFGKDRGGDRESLLSLGQEFDFQVAIVPPAVVGGQSVSSTQIRRLLLDGDVAQANDMLGRRFELSGHVVRGYGRGKGLGCPTANLDGFAAGKLIPRDGIYAAVAETNDHAYPAAVSIGFNPTFDNRRHSVEAHLIGFNGDLYDRKLTIKFVKRLRGEIRFSSEDALSKQMQQDLESVRHILIESGVGVEPRLLQLNATS